jgi:4-amino-4-deoxychorismate lyase
MCLLIETIKVVEGQIQNAAYHNRRLNNARKELFDCKRAIDVIEHLKLKDAELNGIQKCTITYNESIVGIKVQPYTKRKIESLKLIVDNSIDYSYKYADREQLNELSAKRESCDEVLIIKNGLITDTSFSNIVFFDGRKWVTPNKPLLEGTKRQQLIDERIIEVEEIKLSDLKRFSRACLINAMLEMGDTVVDCKNIR